jgi:hypothetical protein
MLRLDSFQCGYRCAAAIPSYVLSAIAKPSNPKPSRQVFNSRPRVCLPIAAGSEKDFGVQTAYTATFAQFYGLLKVVRTTDGRMLFPFEGTPDIGPSKRKSRHAR